MQNKDVSKLSLPKVKYAATTKSEKSTLIQMEVFIKNKNTAAIIMPFNRDILDKFKYEVDGCKWNGEEKYWEFPIVHLPVVFKLFDKYDLRYNDDVEKKVIELMGRRTDLDEIRSQDDDLEYAKQFNNIITVGTILNWNTASTRAKLQKFIKK